MTPLRFGLVALLAVALDQATKVAALAVLTFGDPIAMAPGFNLTIGFNEGASFGMLSGVMAGRPLAMAALTGVITLALAWAGLRARHSREAAGFALIVGGSLGNIVDRLRQGAVTDFLDLYWGDWHWPAFNVADMAIACGAGLLLISALTSRLPERDHA